MIRHSTWKTRKRWPSRLVEIDVDEGGRKAWSEKRAEIMSRPGAGAAYEAARIRFELGEAVRLRREEPGLTQAELAERSGLKQPAVARFEAGGTMPTIPMLERLAEALELRLSVQFQPMREAC